MRKNIILGLLLLMTAGTLLAQDYPKVETSPAFMFIHTPVSLTALPTVNPLISVPTDFSDGFNCLGGGGTIAYNVTKYIGLAADMGGCKYTGKTIPALSEKLTGSDFTYMFGPRFTFRSSSPFRPFFLVNFGGNRFSLKCDACQNSATYSKNAFAMTVGGGFDVQVSKKVSLRLIQAEYLYTRFGNSCTLAFCSNNNNQNSVRIKSGIVVGWGGSNN